MARVTTVFLYMLTNRILLYLLTTCLSLMLIVTDFKRLVHSNRFC
jgi:hypothetical protein